MAKKATVLKKNAKGYGYKYTDLSAIHEYLEEQNLRYFQEIEVVDGVDYIKTTIVDNKDGEPIRSVRGSRVVQAKLSGKENPAQEQGSALTYARRYSLLLALGLATEDDDGETMTTARAGSGGRVDFGEVRQQIKGATSIEELLGIYNSIPQQLQQYFKEDLAKRKEQLNG